MREVCYIFVTFDNAINNITLGGTNEQNFIKMRVISLYSACNLHMHNKTIFTVLVIVFYFSRMSTSTKIFYFCKLI